MALLTRFCLVLLVVSFQPWRFARAQDAATQAMQAAQIANQQAIDAAQLANQQAMDAAQLANQQAQQNMTQAMQNAQNNQYEGLPETAKPSFSIKPGKYPAAIIVRIKDKTRFADIYYTTDGWTPTEHSTRYTGPIVLASTTMLQAIAVAPQHLWSPIAGGTYVIHGAPFVPCNSPASSTTAAPGSAIPVPLLFTSAVDSRTAQIGDTVSLAVARDVTAGGNVLAAKGTPAVGTVTQVNPAGLNAHSGAITFQVKSIDENGKSIPLEGTDSIIAPSVNRTPFYVFMFVPFAGPFIGASSLLVHGHNAVIEPGACVTAYLDPNTSSID